MSFNDDEPIVATPDAPARKPTAFEVGNTKAAIINKTEAPLEQNKFKAMIELSGTGSSSDRSGVDLVMVLDVSASMGGKKLEKMKNAMQFVIRKLSPIDRLSIVTFDGEARRLCPLRQMTENSQGEIENQVNAIGVNAGTNITAGLEIGLKVINERKLTSGRVVGIMLMSDGHENAGSDATKVTIGNMPVYTFGFGANHDPNVLKAVADNSMGGTFSVVRSFDKLGIAFSQCLAGLLTVVVQDLKLTVTQHSESKIDKVSAGTYRQKADNDGSVTVSFGDLYVKEIRKVIVDLLLPEVDKRVTEDVLEVTYTYSTGGKLSTAPPIFVTVTRIKTPEGREKEEVMIEETRVQTAEKIKEARALADDKKLEDAKDKLVEAQSSLDDVVDETNPLVEMLKTELQQLQRLMKSEKLYDSAGRPFALSSETSHDRQRFAARGDVEKLRLFSTPRMDTYLEQAKAFNKDPSQPIPSEADDVKQELAADPLGPFVGALSYYLQIAIQALKSIDNIVNRGR